MKLAGERALCNKAVAEAINDTPVILTALVSRARKYNTDKFYIVDGITAQRVNGRIQIVVTFQPADSVTLSVSVERAQELIEVLAGVVGE